MFFEEHSLGSKIFVGLLISFPTWKTIEGIIQNGLFIYSKNKSSKYSDIEDSGAADVDDIN